MDIFYTVQEIGVGGAIMLQKQFFHVQINITEFRATNYSAFFHPNSFTETK